MRLEGKEGLKLKKGREGVDGGSPNTFAKYG